ncbi:MAG: twin-arginine translocase TatA/TatE family subunit [Nitrososphaerota archaeon]
MALVGVEWIVVAIIVIALLLWGPTKLPELARALGRARREYQKASQEEEEDKLLQLAKSLGIATEGKTREQIAQEVSERLKKA